MTEKRDNVAVKYKDNVFCMLYREKENLLDLYNALRGSNYTNVDDLQVTTLNGGSYMKYKNDASFVLNMSLYMFEQQSRKNENMPLRFLHYLSDVYREMFSNDVLRDVGACFSVNKMLTFECYKQRMERGLTFLEFNYMIMQSYDFYRLFQDYGCNMQFGGDDQWANMLGGTELIRKKLGKDAYAMTITLLLNSEGKKMGKTEKGAVWLDPEKTSPYEFYQYWRNVGDADVIKCLKMLTFVPIEEIEEMEKHMEGAEYNKAKELLAYELTKLVHGKEEADKADAAAKAIFAGGGNSDDMPSTTIAAADLTDGKIGILTLLVKCGLCPSNGEARRLVTQNGIAVNGEKFTDPKGLVDLSEPVVIKKGKKIFHKAIAE